MCVHARVPRPLAAQSVLCETHKSTRRVRAPICPACSPAVCPSPPAGRTVPAPPRTWMENPQKAHAPCPAQISTAPTQPAAAPPAAAFPRLGARTMTCARRSTAILCDCARQCRRDIVRCKGARTHTHHSIAAHGSRRWKPSSQAARARGLVFVTCLVVLLITPSRCLFSVGDLGLLTLLELDHHQTSCTRKGLRLCCYQAESEFNRNPIPFSLQRMCQEPLWSILRGSS